MKHLVALLTGSTFLLAGIVWLSAQAAGTADLDCKLRFSLTGWSAIYKHAEGHGVVNSKAQVQKAVALTKSIKGVRQVDSTALTSRD